jgi:hypothetical protein
MKGGEFMMSRSWATYAGIGTVFVLSLGAVLLLPPGEFVQSLAALPLIGSLVASPISNSA